MILSELEDIITSYQTIGLLTYPIVSAGAVSFNFHSSKSSWPDPKELAKIR